MKKLSSEDERGLSSVIERWLKKRKLLSPNEAIEVSITAKLIRHVSVSTSCAENVLCKKVGFLELPGVRANNCLNNGGIITIGMLCRTSEGELFRIRNFGRKSFTQILSALSVIGLSLDMKIKADEEEKELLLDLPLSDICAWVFLIRHRGLSESVQALRAGDIITIGDFAKSDRSSIVGHLTSYYENRRIRKTWSVSQYNPADAAQSDLNCLVEVCGRFGL